MRDRVDYGVFHPPKLVKENGFTNVTTCYDWALDIVQDRHHL